MLAAAPHTRGYVGDPEPHVLPATGPDPAVGYSGDVEIHTATAEYGRDGHPAIGFLVGTTPDGRRVSGYTDAAGAQVLAAGADIVGRTVHVVDRGGALTVTLTDPVTEESPA